MPAKTPMTWVANWIRVKDQADDPATPASGYAAFYSKGDAPYFKNDAGTEISLTPGVSDSSGWTSLGTWTYASATTATVDAGAAGVYTVGDKIRWKEGGAYEYGYIIAVADTLITIVGSTFAGGAITDNAHSHAETPLGFPSVFAHTATTTGWAASPTQDIAYTINGKTVTLMFVVAGTSNATSASFTLPVAAVAPNVEGALGLARDNNVYKTTACRMYVATTSISFDTDMASGAWTSSNAKEVRGVITYRIA